MISSKASESVANIHNNAENVPFERNNKRLQEAIHPPNDPGKNIPNNTQLLSSTMPFVNPLDASLRQFLGIPSTPTDLIGAMMPYLYPGGAIPPVVPGFNHVQFLSQIPNILPDMTNAALYGIQLVQLQIPKRAIEQIQDRLKDGTCAAAQYSDDCLTSADLGTHLTSEEFACLVEKTIDVGYICKKCHVVFPQIDACSAHQAALCFKDSAAERPPGDTVLKLEQTLYHCSPCRVNCSTVKEFRAHCARERHHGKATTAGVADPGAYNSTRRNSSRLGTSRQKRAESVVFQGGHSLSATRTELKLEDV